LEEGEAFGEEEDLGATLTHFAGSFHGYQDGGGLASMDQ